MKYLVIILFLSLPACSKGYSGIGLTSYIKESNPSYKAEHEFKPTITYSYSKPIKIKELKLILSYSTNRIDNLLFGDKKNDITFNSGTRGVNRQKVTYDSFLACKLYNKWLPCLFIANTKIDNKYYINDSFLSRKINHVLLYGMNINYFFTKQIAGSFSYIFPNDEIYLDDGFVAGITFNF